MSHMGASRKSWPCGIPGQVQQAGARRADTGRTNADARTSRGAVEPQRPTGLKNRDTPSLPGRVLRGLLRFLKSPDELAFGFLFLFFVY